MESRKIAELQGMRDHLEGQMLGEAAKVRSIADRNLTHARGQWESELEDTSTGLQRRLALEKQY